MLHHEVMVLRRQIARLSLEPADRAILWSLAGSSRGLADRGSAIGERPALPKMVPKVSVTG
jgi:hypothetical protein